MEGFRETQVYAPIPSLPFTVNRQSDQARGLVAWWPLNDLAGWTMECKISAGNRARVGETSLGAFNSLRPAYLDGALGVRITGNSSFGQYITTGFTDSLGDFTACCWFRFEADNVVFGRILDKDQGVLNTGFRMEENGFLPDVRANIFGTTISLTGAVTLGKTYHGVVRREGTSGAFILNAGASKGTAVVASTALSTSALGIGASSGGSNRTEIQVRDVRIYNRALSDNEILALYNPVTRYELYAPLGQKPYGIPIGVPGLSSGQVIIVG